MRKNILITGASSGLGAGMARLWAADNRNLVLCARRAEKLAELKQELGGGDNIRTELLDVCDYGRVFELFREIDVAVGGLDRVIVNAGIGKGGKLGTGLFADNCKTAETNYIAAMAQMEAAMELFRSRNAGHLVVISSVASFRGMPGQMTNYAASKAAVKSLAEGLRAELLNSPIKVTTIYPGYILTDINRHVENAPMRVSLEAGCRALVKTIDAEVDESSVPSWPWKPMGVVMRHAPLSVLRKMM